MTDRQHGGGLARLLILTAVFWAGFELGAWIF